MHMGMHYVQNFQKRLAWSEPSTCVPLFVFPAEWIWVGTSARYQNLSHRATIGWFNNSGAMCLQLTGFGWFKNSAMENSLQLMEKLSPGEHEKQLIWDAVYVKHLCHGIFVLAEKNILHFHRNYPSHLSLVSRNMFHPLITRGSLDSFRSPNVTLTKILFMWRNHHISWLPNHHISWQIIIFH